MLGPMRMVFEAIQVPRVIASLPSIEGLRADVKVAAGETNIVTM